MQVIEGILALERPDLAVLSGDMVSGFMWDSKPGWFEKRLLPLFVMQGRRCLLRCLGARHDQCRACAGGGS